MKRFGVAAVLILACVLLPSLWRAAFGQSGGYTVVSKRCTACKREAIDLGALFGTAACLLPASFTSLGFPLREQADFCVNNAPRSIALPPSRTEKGWPVVGYPAFATPAMIGSNRNQ